MGEKRWENGAENYYGEGGGRDIKRGWEGERVGWVTPNKKQKGRDDRQ